MDSGSRTLPANPAPGPSQPPALGTALLVVLLVGSLAPSSVAAPAPGARAAASNYIVELAAAPLAGYSGGIQGLSATSPRATGRRLDLTSAAARTYRAYLDEKERQVLTETQTAPEAVIERYRIAFPGFAARLTPQQAAGIGRSQSVAHVWPDRMGHPTQAAPQPRDTASPIEGDDAEFLGLPDGLWQELGGPDSAGAGVIVGVIDTGIYPEHPSFADQPETNGRRNYIGAPYSPPKVWNGACQGGESFPTSSCNNKLIGARYFVAGFGRDNVHSAEFLSPRDANGHGSHTASTAAGNYGVDPVLGGSDLGIGLISGTAPRAYVSAYKVCWSGKSDPDNPMVNTDGCLNSDSLAAIDAAVADGVDVINYSVGSPSPDPVDPLELAFLYASDAGIFVATSTGNEGPEPRTIGSPAGAPWVTSVAATTPGRKFVGGATLSDANGAEPPLVITNVPWTGSLRPKALVEAKNVPASGAPDAAAELCLPDSVDPARVAGKVVLCKRGQNPLIEKGRTLHLAGAAGMIIYNTPDKDDVVTLTHWLPAVHVKAADGARIKAFMTRTPDPRAAISGGPAPERGDVLAPFSSRGPQVGVPDIAKPDVAAPGVDILAANTPTPAEPLLRPGETFQIISGTSMASPHVAGAGALLTQLHPTLSPAAIKSSLMTTARTQVVTHDGKTPAGPFDTGSGRIDPSRAADPGLVTDVGTPEYAGYLESIDPTIVPDELTPIAPADLNLPAISFGAFLGQATTSRTFTSVDPTATTWRASVEGLKGIQVEISPSTFTISPGQTQRVDLRLTRSQAPFDKYVSGQLLLADRDSGRMLHLPLTVDPVRMSVPSVISVPTQAASGTEPVTFKAGFTGAVSVQGFGLAAPEIEAGKTIVTGAPRPTPTAGTGVHVYDVTVEPGTQALGAATLNPVPEAFTDLDLFLYYDADGDGFQDTDLIGQSAGPTGTESFAVIKPEAGAYRFSVLGYATHPPASKYDFGLWVVNDPSPDNPSNAPGLAVRDDPVDVAPGGQGTFTLEWSGLPADGLYLGLTSYYDGPPATTEPFGSSLVVIDRGPPAEPAPSWRPSPIERSMAPPWEPQLRR